MCTTTYDVQFNHILQRTDIHIQLTGMRFFSCYITSMTVCTLLLIICSTIHLTHPHNLQRNGVAKVLWHACCVHSLYNKPQNNLYSWSSRYFGAYEGMWTLLLLEVQHRHVHREWWNLIGKTSTGSTATEVQVESEWWAWVGWIPTSSMGGILRLRRMAERSVGEWSWRCLGKQKWSLIKVLEDQWQIQSSVVLVN